MEKISVYVAVNGTKFCGHLCNIVNKSVTTKLSGSSLSGSSGKLKIGTPDVLLIGVDFWIKSRIDLRKAYPNLNILVITSFSAYNNNQNIRLFNEEFLNTEALNNEPSTRPKIGFGFISDEALPEVIISAIETVSKGISYRYGFDDPNVPHPADRLNTLLRETIQKLETDSPREKIAVLSQIIDILEENRIEMIKDLSVGEKSQLDAERLDNLIENLIIRGYKNWDIAKILSIDIKAVRTYRMKLIHQLTGTNSMAYTTRRTGEVVAVSENEKKHLLLIAAGYTNNDIAAELNISIETVKTHRQTLKRKFNADAEDSEESETTMSMIIHALRMGLIKIEVIEEYRRKSKEKRKENKKRRIKENKEKPLPHITG